MTGDSTAQAAIQTLGERIVEAARLAAAVHLFESLATNSPNYGRRVGIGGAGPFRPEAGDSASPGSASHRPLRQETFAKDGTESPAPPPAEGGAGSK